MSEHENRLEPESIQETERLTYYLHKDIAPRDLFLWLTEQFKRDTQVIIDWQENIGEADYRKSQVDAILSALHAHSRHTEKPANLTIQGHNLNMLRTGLYFEGYMLNKFGRIIPLAGKTE